MKNSGTEMPILKNLTITGDIYIEPLPATEKVPGGSWIYLIMGPTGAGKSSFIEALSGGTQYLQISKDQLSGYTQRVTAYQLMNMRNNDYPVFLVDTPGFSDPKISETEIMDMVRHWLAKNDIPYFDTILFLTPITEPRLPGSKRRTIEMLKSFLKPSQELGSIIFVTTMWDQLNSERTQHRVESNFAQLKNDILKEFIDEGATIEKFRNTTNSSLQILDTSCGGIVVSGESFSRASLLLYQDLHERIEGAVQKKKTLESDLADNAQACVALKSILEEGRSENEEMLTKFIGQFVRFGRVPIEFEDAAQGLRRKIVAEVTPINPRYKEIFDLWASGADLAELPEDLYLDHPPPTLALKGVLRRLRKASKRHGLKWFKLKQDA